MKKMGKYCRAYVLCDLRQYPDWFENSNAARRTDEKGEPLALPRVLTDDSLVYIQENLVVTDDIYRDENVIFDAVTPEWCAFCTQVLGFTIPEDVAASESNDNSGVD